MLEKHKITIEENNGRIDQAYLEKTGVYNGKKLDLANKVFVSGPQGKTFSKLSTTLQEQTTFFVIYPYTDSPQQGIITLVSDPSTLQSGFTIVDTNFRSVTDVVGAGKPTLNNYKITPGTVEKEGANWKLASVGLFKWGEEKKQKREGTDEDSTEKQLQNLNISYEDYVKSNPGLTPSAIEAFEKDEKKQKRLIEEKGKKVLLIIKYLKKQIAAKVLLTTEPFNYNKNITEVEAEGYAKREIELVQFIIDRVEPDLAPQESTPVANSPETLEKPDVLLFEAAKKLSANYQVSADYFVKTLNIEKARAESILVQLQNLGIVGEDVEGLRKIFVGSSHSHEKNIKNIKAIFDKKGISTEDVPKVKPSIETLEVDLAILHNEKATKTMKNGGDMLDAFNIWLRKVADMNLDNLSDKDLAELAIYIKNIDSRKDEFNVYRDKKLAYDKALQILEKEKVQIDKIPMLGMLSLDLNNLEGEVKIKEKEIQIESDNLEAETIEYKKEYGNISGRLVESIGELIKSGITVSTQKPIYINTSGMDILIVKKGEKMIGDVEMIKVIKFTDIEILKKFVEKLQSKGDEKAAGNAPGAGVMQITEVDSSGVPLWEEGGPLPKMYPGIPTEVFDLIKKDLDTIPEDTKPLKFKKEDILSLSINSDQKVRYQIMDTKGEYYLIGRVDDDLNGKKGNYFLSNEEVNLPNPDLIVCKEEDLLKWLEGDKEGIIATENPLTLKNEKVFEKVQNPLLENKIAVLDTIDHLIALARFTKGKEDNIPLLREIGDEVSKLTWKGPVAKRQEILERIQKIKDELFKKEEKEVDPYAEITKGWPEADADAYRNLMKIIAEAQIALDEQIEIFNKLKEEDEEQERIESISPGIDESVVYLEHRIIDKEPWEMAIDEKTLDTKKLEQFEQIKSKEEFDQLDDTDSITDIGEITGFGTEQVGKYRSGLYSVDFVNNLYEKMPLGLVLKGSKEEEVRPLFAVTTKEDIEKAAKEGKYVQAIKAGKMTLEKALYILENAQVDVPKDLLALKKKMRGVKEKESIIGKLFDKQGDLRQAGMFPVSEPKIRGPLPKIKTESYETDKLRPEFKDSKGVTWKTGETVINAEGEVDRIIGLDYLGGVYLLSKNEGNIDHTCTVTNNLEKFENKDKIIEGIQKAIDEGKYLKWIEEKRMTKKEAIQIIESAELEIPKSLLAK